MNQCKISISFLHEYVHIYVSIKIKLKRNISTEARKKSKA